MLPLKFLRAAVTPFRINMFGLGVFDVYFASLLVVFLSECRNPSCRPIAAEGKPETDRTMAR